MDFFFDDKTQKKIQHDLIMSVLHYEALLVHRASWEQYKTGIFSRSQTMRRIRTLHI